MENVIDNQNTTIDGQITKNTNLENNEKFKQKNISNYRDKNMENVIDNQNKIIGYQITEDANNDEQEYVQIDDYRWLNIAWELSPLLAFDSHELYILSLVILSEITGQPPLAKIENRNRKAIGCLLANLYYGYKFNVPVRFSRDKGYYDNKKRQGKNFFKFKRLNDLVNGLFELDYIIVTDDTKKLAYGDHSRIWATPKLLDKIKNVTDNTDENALKILNRKLV